MYCTKCGNKSPEGDVFCRKCGAALSDINARPSQSQNPITTPQTYSSHGLVCPRCGSANVQKYSLWKKSSNKGLAGVAAGLGAGFGCLSGTMGCLIVVLLLIFAPFLLILFGLGLAAVFPIILVLIGIVTIGLVIYAIMQSYDSGHYICLKCEHIFKP